MKIKTKTSDDESTCSEITQDPFFLKSPPRMITQPTVQQEQSVPSQDKKQKDITKKQEKARAIKFDVKKENQKNEFLDETSIGEIYDEESRTEPHNDSTKSTKLKHSRIETAFSARSSGTKYKYKNGTKICSQDSLNSVRKINDNNITMEQHKIQELCLREISHREKYINSKVIGNPYPKYTDQTIYRKTGERIDIISDTNSYTEEINQKLPEMDSILHPVCSMEMSYHFSSLISCKGDDWKPFGYERKIELLRIEGSVLFHQLRKLNLTHAWKEIYTNVNEFCDSHGIPYKNRKRMYLREIEMISLFIHDCLPHNYAEQGIWAGDTSLSKYYNFFSPYNPLPIARKKWKDFIGDDYAYFWDSFISNDFESLNDQDFVKLDDLFEIIKFINPEGIRLFLKNCEFYDKTIFVRKRAKVIKHWVLSRHKSYYAWIIFGWRTLEHSTPSYNSSENPNFPIPSRWIPKSLSYDDFIKKDLYKIYKRNDKSQVHQFY